MAIQIAIGGDLEVYSSGTGWAKVRCTNGAAPDWTTQIETDGDGFATLSGVVTTPHEQGFIIRWNAAPSDYRLVVITHGGGDGLFYGNNHPTTGRTGDNGSTDWANLESAHKCRIVDIKWFDNGVGQGWFSRPSTVAITLNDCDARVVQIMEWIHTNLNQRNVPLALIGSSGGANAVLAPFTLNSALQQRIHYACPASYPQVFWNTHAMCHAATPPGTYVDKNTGELSNDSTDVGVVQSGNARIDYLLDNTKCTLQTITEGELAGFHDEDNLDGLTPSYVGTLHVTVGQVLDVGNGVIWGAGNMKAHAFWSKARVVWFSSVTDTHGSALDDIFSQGFAEVHRELASLADTLGGNMAAMSDYLEVELRKALFRTNTVTARANSTAYSVGDRVQLGTSDLNVYECITAGTSAASPPAFNTNLGDTTTDGGVVWLTLKHGYPKRPVYVALFTAAPSDSGGGTEVSGGSYARVAVAPADANWSAPDATGGLTDNIGAITFPTPTANWGVISHVGIFDRLTGGNLLFHGALAQSKTVNNGDPAPSFPAGSLDVTLA